MNRRGNKQVINFDGVNDEILKKINLWEIEIPESLIKYPVDMIDVDCIHDYHRTFYGQYQIDAQIKPQGQDFLYISLDIINSDRECIFRKSGIYVPAKILQQAILDTIHKTFEATTTYNHHQYHEMLGRYQAIEKEYDRYKNTQIDIEKQQFLLQKERQELKDTRAQLKRDRMDFEQSKKPTNGFVYFIQDTVTGHIKIGKSKNPKARLSQLQTSTVNELKLLHIIECEDMDEIETALHKRFEDKHIRGEWFSVSIEEIPS